MKSILMSIQPKWVEKIISGEKTIEVRKTAPKEVPFKVYIYCTKGQRLEVNAYRDKNSPIHFSLLKKDEDYDRLINGKVIGEFVCNKVELFDIPYPAWWSEEKETINLFEKGSCLFINELYKYANKKPIFGLHISDLKTYDKPKELSEFYPINSYLDELGLYQIPLYHRPQSWQYIEVPYDK